MSAPSSPRRGAAPDARALLDEAVAASGLSLRQFAERLAWRDERTVRRWRSGDSPIGEAATQALQRFLALSPRQREQAVRLALRDG